MIYLHDHWHPEVPVVLPKLLSDALVVVAHGVGRGGRGVDDGGVDAYRKPACN